MMAKRRPVTLLERFALQDGGYALASHHELARIVRAELRRLARQVRASQCNLKTNAAVFKKSKHPQDYILYERCLASIATLNEVLALIKEAAK